jgi:kumamolisin
LSTERVPLEGSRPRSTGGVQNCSDAPAAQIVTATVSVRRRRERESQSRLDAIMRGEAAPMSREEAAQNLGADPDDLRKIEEFAQAHGLTVTESSVPKRSVKLSGTVAQMEAAFGAKLRVCQSGGQSYLIHEDTLTVPSSLAGIVEAVLGLDQRPVARRDDAE